MGFICSPYGPSEAGYAARSYDMRYICLVTF